METKKVYDKHAQAYNDRFMPMDSYDEGYAEFCEMIPENGKLLELACGPGNITTKIYKQRPDLEILATDFSESMIKIARQNVPAAAFDILDIKKLSDHSYVYNGVICGFGMPYLSDEECSVLIKDVAKVLKPHGVFYFSTMEGTAADSGYEFSSFGGDDQLYINYHEESFLKKCLETNGFEVVKLERLDYEEKDGSISVDMIFIARKIA